MAVWTGVTPAPRQTFGLSWVAQRMLTPPAQYRGNNDNMDALMSLMDATGGNVRVSAHVPAAVSSKQNATRSVGHVSGFCESNMGRDNHHSRRSDPSQEGPDCHYRRHAVRQQIDTGGRIPQATDPACVIGGVQMDAFGAWLGSLEVRQEGRGQRHCWPFPLQRDRRHK